MIPNHLEFEEQLTTKLKDILLIFYKLIQLSILRYQIYAKHVLFALFQNRNKANGNRQETNIIFFQKTEKYILIES